MNLRTGGDNLNRSKSIIQSFFIIISQKYQSTTTFNRLSNIKTYIMGNAAAKEYDSTEISDAKDIVNNESLSILPSLVTDQATRAESKGKQWITSETDAFLWSTKQVGMIKSHSLIQDEEGKTFATVIVEKMGMTFTINFVCKSIPSFEGQDPLSAEELKKAGIEEGTVLYKFSKIDTVRKMTTATSNYSIVTGKDDEGGLTFQTLYTAQKLSAMGFMGIVREGETAIAKVQTVGMKMKPVIEAATGVDLLAAVLIGYTLAGGDNAAGALAGAGVI